MLFLFAMTIFLSALLLFMVQPMAAKGILPLLGGSPAVWNTCMVFFQALLLCGYAYAHALSRLRSKWAQVGIHGAVIVLASATLPIVVPRGVALPSEGGETLWLLGLLATMVGGPFFLLSTTGPLVQSWFARTGHPSASDPYFLYGASNAGSFIGLLGFPLAIEPLMGLRDQGVWWAVGFGALAPLLIVCGVVMAQAVVRAPTRQARRAGKVPAAPTLDASPVTWKRRGWWVFLAFVPSSLTLGTTQYLSTDIAAIPLLWVVPLAIYLLTFIIAFSKRELVPTESLSKLLPFIVVAIGVAFLMHAREPIAMLIGLHVLLMTLGSLLCHKRLADARPEVSRLTEFYLWIAVGGVLGGIFNALVAPLAFNDVYEYPIAIGLACMSRIAPGGVARSVRSRMLDVAVPLAVLLIAAGTLPAMQWVFRLGGMELQGGWLVKALTVGLPCIACFLAVGRPLRFSLCAVAILVYAFVSIEPTFKVLHKERTFFGVLRVLESMDGAMHTLRHGTTTHGTQFMIPEYRDLPTTYYHPDGPLGDLLFVYREGPMLRRVAVIGMGTGAIAAYGRPGDVHDFYEIDPAVDRIARNTKWFRYLSDSKATVNVIIGDGRREIAEAPDGSYGLIVVDAFSSDAIPVHLITREAIELYMKKLAPGGVLTLHISNRHVNLNPPLVGIAASLGLKVVSCAHQSPKQLATDAWTSVWVAIGREPGDLEPLLAKGADRRDWWVFEPNERTPVWTDDHANVLQMFKW
ncbi:MAG: fused MFS/spermidine synthase [Phycisphaeraceae bacterium]|nr:fused MFS/spermidine synthase [Phycisphaeraceae bacterium]MBX3365784.1 fused MFS/spermidine synthase [Phycisphaeraceae bacterium]